jgi:hypothetical protein
MATLERDTVHIEIATNGTSTLRRRSGRVPKYGSLWLERVTPFCWSRQLIAEIDSALADTGIRLHQPRDVDRRLAAFVVASDEVPFRRAAAAIASLVRFSLADEALIPFRSMRGQATERSKKELAVRQIIEAQPSLRQRERVEKLARNGRDTTGAKRQCADPIP